MRRRHLLVSAATAVLSFPAQAQQARRVAILTGLAADDPATRARLAGFREGMAAAGWREGQNLAIDVRYEPSSAERARRLAAELIALKPDIALAQGLPSVLALRGESIGLPIVFVGVPDPVNARLVESLARPGAQTTGFTSTEPSFGAKWIELLMEISPATKRLLVLTQQSASFYRPGIEHAMKQFGVEVAFAQVHSAAEIQTVLDGFAGTAAGAGGLILPTDLFTASHRRQIIELAARHRLPLITGNPPFPPDGGLMYYGADFVDLYRRAAGYVDRILRGSRPADLPVQQPDTFLMSINLKTAAALGLTVPPTLRARSDEVFE
ncbi:MAG: ABC transporter substrate-binding protein [Reyranella sp.]|nr:ABC transporter substrate-binding protein [Reyranella sp.]